MTSESLHSQVKAVEEQNSRLQTDIAAARAELAAAKMDIAALKVKNDKTEAERFAYGVDRTLVSSVNIGIVDENTTLRVEIEALKAGPTAGVPQQASDGEEASRRSTSHSEQNCKSFQLRPGSETCHC
jgi:hypothetical protein